MATPERRDTLPAPEARLRVRRVAHRYIRPPPRQAMLLIQQAQTFRNRTSGISRPKVCGICTAGSARPRRVHLTTNIVIALNGDQATVESNWSVIQNSASGPKIGSAGAYQDQVAKVGGRWLFRYRKIDRFIADGLM